MKTFIAALTIILATCSLYAKEYHVSINGLDGNPGTQTKPFKTISAAAQVAQGGDVITVHEGTYRERVKPPRGGISDDKRIVYRAAEGEDVIIKGSEPIKGWQKVQNDTWKVVIPNSFFGNFNPYGNLISGDWFNPMGREHHTGAVYLNDHWLTEAKTLDDVLKPIGKAAASYSAGSAQYLTNLAWLKAGKSSERVNAAAFAEQQGTQVWTDENEGECLGWIEEGDWVRYEGIDFGGGTGQIEFLAASATLGGVIEIRLDKPEGEILGTCSITNTGGWYSWSSFKAEIEPVSGVKTICLVFKSGQSESRPELRLWYGEVDPSNTTIWAQFKDINPNEADVEINVRQAVFYPEQTGINYITVRGFTMMHAATPWAPPTAEQIGLIGTNWSKGWIIEDNDISYSVCTGVTLGKHGDEFDNTSQDTAEGYVETIKRAHKRGWSKENIGGHIVRNNHISHCEQAGLVGSMGAVFSSITGNEIHDIHIRQLFTGAEMAGIKIHAAIDTEISNNHIYRTSRGIWLDWMTQGTLVARNLLHDNGPSEDLFVEVNHGPFMVEHNMFLSKTSLGDMSEGGAYVHNLFAGSFWVSPELNRDTPYHPAHTTKVAGLVNTKGGDNRFYNNIFVNSKLQTYDVAAQTVFMDGNVFLNGAVPCKYEQNPLVQEKFDAGIELVEKDDGIYLQIELEKAWVKKQSHRLVTTELLGKAKVSGLPYEQPEGSKYRIDTDWFGRKRNVTNPFPGPFEPDNGGKQALKIRSTPDKK